MARPRKNAAYSPTKSNLNMQPSISNRTQRDWSWENTLELCALDSQNEDVAFIDNLIVVSISREFKRRFSILGDAVYKEIICALKTVMWTHMKTDFPNSNPIINIILPQIDFGITINNVPESTYLCDQRIMQERLDEACRMLAQAIRI